MQPMTVRPHLSHRTLNKDFIVIPGTGLRVSRVALGTRAMGSWMGEGTDFNQSVATVHAALDQGINLIDTAPVYGLGVAEEIVGRALADAGIRARTVIATKTGLEWHDGKVYRNATRERIMHEVEDSLRRLRTDYIDIYQVHWPDPLVPIEETAEAMYALYKQGKVRAIGVSNFSVDEMKRFAHIAPLHVLQSPYNLFERTIERDVLPYCFSQGIVTLGESALCRGLLSGRMRRDSVFAGDDVRCHDARFQPPRLEHYLQAVRQLDQVAREHHRRVIHLAVRWILDQGVSVALWGGRQSEHMEPALGVSGWSLDATTRARIDRILRQSISNPREPQIIAPQQRSRVAAKGGEPRSPAQRRNGT